MSPWLSIVLLGFAIFGFAWLSPRAKREEEAGGGADPAYDRLLEELETENRELLDAVSKFKQEQDETVKGLIQQIAELERRFQTAEESPRNGPAAPATGAAVSESAQAVRTADVPPAAPAQTEPSPEAAPAESGDRSPPPAARGPASIRDRYADLLALHAKGRSIEQIAKSAGMNKGEVQLILQLARREEEQLA
ncbi:DUF6115 domain-containing protein [Cohnella caldifontis]|uniref:DUF6115 domain-containing protein n=1 Tax=Cohnella caldifontis TaxID=3027471 RepID=UPI0023EB9C28|nr:hypothetical protein [Cohnella sp. YIM B05605]